jgi:hypothetical protein
MPMELYWEDISMTPGMIHLDGVKKDPRSSAVITSLNLKSIILNPWHKFS